MFTIPEPVGNNHISKQKTTSVSTLKGRLTAAVFAIISATAFCTDDQGTLFRRQILRILGSTMLKEFTPDGAVCESNGEEVVLSGYDSIVLAMGSRPYNPLEEAAKAVCGEVYVIGDAHKAGDATAAIEDAALFTLNLR